MFSTYSFSVIRPLRKRQGLTLEHLAKNAGLTYPTVASVENNKALPSMKTLDAIAGALHLSASSLLALAERRMVQIRKAQVPDSSGHVSSEVGMDKCRVASFDKSKVIRVKAEAGEEVHVMGLHEGCHEMCYVLCGSVALRVLDNVHELRADDAILFDGVLDHGYTMLEAGEFVTIHIPKDVHILESLLDTVGK